MSEKSDPLCTTTFTSSLGWFAVVWKGTAVSRLTFAHASRKKALQGLPGIGSVVPVGRCPAPDLVARLQAYADGIPEDFSDIPVDTAHLTRFAGRVVEACRKIPYGKTTSYAGLAEQAGSPKAPRAVGQCMASNRVPIIIPCHRVVAADGRLGGFSAPGGIQVKRRLLDLERKASDFA